MQRNELSTSLNSQIVGDLAFGRLKVNKLRPGTSCHTSGLSCLLPGSVAPAIENDAHECSSAYNHNDIPHTKMILRIILILQKRVCQYVAPTLFVARICTVQARSVFDFTIVFPDVRIIPGQIKNNIT